MIITQTPVRISFFGGGTDYPAYFRKHGGETLVSTIDKYTIITIHTLNNLVDYSIRVHYSKVESISSLDAIQHVSARECMRYLGIAGGIEIHYVSDLPARTGMGSSSSATVGLLHGLHAFKGEMVNQEDLAREAVHVEQEMIKERVGCQDQYACAIGGLLHLKFRENGTVDVRPIAIKPQRLGRLQECLMLMYTGDTRNAHDVLDEQLERTESGENEANLARMKNLVAAGLEILSGEGDLVEFGKLLHESWILKRQLSSKIATSSIDEAYQRAVKAGATGGKLLGAGGGGFLLLYVEPELRQKVKEALSPLREAPFSFENTGSRVIYFRH